MYSNKLLKTGITFVFILTDFVMLCLHPAQSYAASCLLSTHCKSGALFWRCHFVCLSVCLLHATCTFRNWCHWLSSAGSHEWPEHCLV